LAIRATDTQQKQLPGRKHVSDERSNTLDPVRRHEPLPYEDVLRLREVVIGELGVAGDIGAQSHSLSSPDEVAVATVAPSEHLLFGPRHVHAIDLSVLEVEA
jgi:hypothetical protein